MIRRFKTNNNYYYLLDVSMEKILTGGHLNTLSNFGTLMLIIQNFLVFRLWMLMKQQDKLCGI